MAQLKRLRVQNPESGIYEEYDDFYDAGAISYNAQNLTEAQKAQARANIGVSAGVVDTELDATSLNAIANKPVARAVNRLDAALDTIAKEYRDETVNYSQFQVETDVRYNTETGERIEQSGYNSYIYNLNRGDRLYFDNYTTTLTFFAVCVFEGDVFKGSRAKQALNDVGNLPTQENPLVLSNDSRIIVSTVKSQGFDMFVKKTAYLSVKDRLSKNLGVENKNKALYVDENGDIVCKAPDVEALANDFYNAINKSEIGFIEIPHTDSVISKTESAYLDGVGGEKANGGFDIFYFTTDRKCSLYILETSSIYNAFYNAYRFSNGTASELATIPIGEENTVVLEAGETLGITVKKNVEFNYYIKYDNNFAYAVSDEVFNDIQDRLKNGDEKLEWLACGDSITAGGLYVGHINNDGRFNVTNIGVGGKSWISHYEVVKGESVDNPLPADFDWNKYDIITIMLGTNYQFNGATCDFSKLDGNYQNYTNQAEYPEMFVYHCCAYLEYVMEHKREDALLFVLCPPKWTNPNSGSEEAQNAYHTELKRILAWYSIPCIDVNENCYINRVNADKYLRDTLHPNELGAKKIADAIISGVNKWLD